MTRWVTCFYDDVFHQAADFRVHPDRESALKYFKQLGEWIDREVYDAPRWKCSECGRTEPYKENFCPNCGLPMNEKALEILRKREGKAE